VNTREKTTLLNYAHTAARVAIDKENEKIYGGKMHYEIFFLRFWSLLSSTHFLHSRSKIENHFHSFEITRRPFPHTQQLKRKNYFIIQSKFEGSFQIDILALKTRFHS
jgi:hypothetical protein